VKDPARERLRQIFSYLRELTHLRTPPVCEAKAYPWSLVFSALPTHPAVQQNTRLPDSEDYDGVVLRVMRPTETRCPDMPPVLAGWVRAGWDSIADEVAKVDARNFVDHEGQTRTESFDSSSQRVAAFVEWERRRTAWRAAEKPVREAAVLYGNLFNLLARMQRESEKHQLFLADGHFVWKSAHGDVHHPLLLQKVEIEFNPIVPEFVIRETEDAPELYTELLRFHELDGGGIKACKARLLEDDPHPLGHAKTSAYFEFLIRRFFEKGQSFASQSEAQRSTDPHVFRGPMLFLGSRTQSFTESLDKLIESVAEMNELPEALYRIVGFEMATQSAGASPGGGAGTAGTGAFKDKHVDYLLTKPANREQERIISRLETSGSVLVQGPPGTGKSHTIANIIGHLLALGKTVLVASHTSKALRVVREKVAAPIRPLCVSVLDNDSESKAQLEESVNGIVGYLSRTDKDTLDREIEQLRARREELKSQSERLQDESLQIRKHEYSDIVIEGKGIPPSEAARQIREHASLLGLIPGKISDVAPFPLTSAELVELYASNSALNADHEACIDEGLLDEKLLLPPSRFEELVVRFAEIDLAAVERFHPLWTRDYSDVRRLEALAAQMSYAAETLDTHHWASAVLEAGRIGTEQLAHWENLVLHVNRATKEIATKSELVFQHGPRVQAPITAEIASTLAEIVGHLRAGKSLGFFSTVLKSAWKNVLAVCSVDTGAPTSLAHFESLLALVEVELLRNEIRSRWQRQVIPTGAQGLPDQNPEGQAKLQVEVISTMITWHKDGWRHIESELHAEGFNLKEALKRTRSAKRIENHVDELRTLISEVLLPALQGRILWTVREALKKQKELLSTELIRHDGKPSSKRFYLHALSEAIHKHDVAAYERGFSALLELISKVGAYNGRLRILMKLGAVAPAWEAAIARREGIHRQSTPPSDLEAAWRLKQLQQALDARLASDYSKVQRAMDRARNDLQEVTGQYVEKLSWRYQLERTGLKERQALAGWQQLQAKLTKTGRGKLDAVRKREAKKLLATCKGAVPVWVMPLSKVFESFDLTSEKFDVVILDEASQSDVTALAAFAIARQIIVVGDKEQVTPQAVGQELQKVQGLIDELLYEVPNRMLYDGKTSVYHLAEQSFGETIRLVEHFRCVPDIIQFSNLLSYRGEIKPLREAASSPFEEHVIAHRVDGGRSVNKVNRQEALEVASLIAAMTEMKEYSKETVGVISLLGQEQAIVIDDLLQHHLRPEIYQGHRILCGSASQFQGDERGVIIISVVDSCEDPPLNIRQTEDFKKIFNVAASRAQNQLWVVHSLNPATDLKPGDLRLRLIQHAENPYDILSSIQRANLKAESPFESLVMADLIRAGFRITPQWEVGAYRIDMIVEGKTQRIALECDGDRFHPAEKLADDIQRQLVLERLGWRFIRVRGSEYFRDPAKAMTRIISELEAFGIERLGAATTTKSRPRESSALRRSLIERAIQLRLAWEAENSRKDEETEK
jgi:very-short-patch-repair endonuclease